MGWRRDVMTWSQRHTTSLFPSFKPFCRLESQTGQQGVLVYGSVLGTCSLHHVEWFSHEHCDDVYEYDL